MNVTEILQFVDHLVFTQTDKHLDDLQKKIIEELFNGKTYRQIASIYDYDEGYIGDESRKLFKMLSDGLGQEVNKSNFCWTIERVTNCSKIVSFENNNINCYSHHQKSNHYQEDHHPKQSKSSYHDLTVSPKITRFYGREKELELIFKFIVNQNTHLISILGLPGIGKTSLVKRFVDLNLDKFEVIIWKSLKFPKSLDLLIDDCLNILEKESPKSTDDKLRKFLDVLNDKKCLIVIDDVENIFASGKYAGIYLDEYKNYQNLFTMIAEIKHQSSLILISREKCPEMEFSDSKLSAIKYLELFGLKNVEVFKNQGLQDEDSWFNLINLYEGNPLYLKDIAVLIQDIFAGYVTEFLGDNNLVITKNMQVSFHQIFNRLSPIEQQIVLELSKSHQPLSREDVRQGLNLSSNLSSMELINGLQSLKQRYLLTTIVQEKVLFQLSSVFKEYLRII
ncbi:MAG: NB-ARC domain-containing protein [Dolichospermum sp.]